MSRKQKIIGLNGTSIPKGMVLNGSGVPVSAPTHLTKEQMQQTVSLSALLGYDQGFQAAIESLRNAFLSAKEKGNTIIGLDEAGLLLDEMVKLASVEIERAKSEIK